MDTEDKKKRCEFELIVEKYFGFPSTIQEDTKVTATYGQLVGLVVAATPEERFKKPTDEQFVEFAIVVNNGGLDPEKLTDMVAMCQLIVDRLYENGDMLIPSSKENNKNE